MKRKIFMILVLVVTLLAGCGTATNNDVPTNGVTEAPSVIEQAEPTVEPTMKVEPTAEPTVTVAPTETLEVEPTEAPVVEPTEAPVVEPTEAPEVTPEVEPTATPEPTPEPTVAPTEAPTPTETPVASTADWRDFVVTLGGYTVKLGETTLRELLDAELIEIYDEEEVLARELDCGVGNTIEPCDGTIGNFDVANYEANTVKSPADCVILSMAQDFWSETEKLKLEVCGIGVGDEANLESLEAVFGKCSEEYREDFDEHAWYTWYANGTDSEEGCIEIIVSDYYGTVYDLKVWAPYGDVTIYDSWAYYD